MKIEFRQKIIKREYLADTLIGRINCFLIKDTDKKRPYGFLFLSPLHLRQLGRTLVAAYRDGLATASYEIVLAVRSHFFATKYISPEYGPAIRLTQWMNSGHGGANHLSFKVSEIPRLLVLIRRTLESKGFEAWQRSWNAISADTDRNIDTRNPTEELALAREFTEQRKRLGYSMRKISR